MAIDDRIVGGLINLGVFLCREGNRILEPSGLNQQQFLILCVIVKRGCTSQKVLLANLPVEKSHLSKVIKKLRANNLICTEPLPKDRRMVSLKPTHKGKMVCEEYMALMNTWNQEWLKALSENEKRKCGEVLDRLKLLIKN